MKIRKTNVNSVGYPDDDYSILNAIGGDNFMTAYTQIMNGSQSILRHPDTLVVYSFEPSKVKAYIIVSKGKWKNQSNTIKPVATTTLIKAMIIKDIIANVPKKVAELETSDGTIIKGDDPAITNPTSKTTGQPTTAGNKTSPDYVPTEINGVPVTEVKAIEDTSGKTTTGDPSKILGMPKLAVIIGGSVIGLAIIVIVVKVLIKKRSK